MITTMSKFVKSDLTVQGNHLRVSMPFTKVDKANRLVSGFATLDNLDTQGDVVLAEASAKAFQRARGNVREMHQPIAAGKMVDFREEEFFHDGEFYRGIFVTAHVSKGAESTWQKVLDETLTGFSIGGEINEADNEFVKEANGGKGGNVRFIKDYDLTELSLVDNPANQLANVVSIQKSANGSVTVTMGEVADTVVENVFICANDETVVVKATESEVCPICENTMENAGWFQSGDNRAEKVQEIVTKFLNPGEKEATPTESEGGVEMGVKKQKDEVVPPGEKTVSVPNPSETFPDGTPIEQEAHATEEEDTAAAADVDETDEEVEKVASPDEVVEEDEEAEITKRLSELQTAITKSLETNREETASQVAELEKKIDEALQKSSELEKKIDGFGESITTQKSKLSDLEKKLNKVNSSGAMKKSTGAEPVVEEPQKSNFWHGAFSD